MKQRFLYVIGLIVILNINLFGAHDYSPETGRWTAEDPIGFWSGDINFYAYCANDPVNYIDPSGLSKEGKDGLERGCSGNNRVLQSGGNTISKRTAKELNLTPEQVRDAIHALKDDHRLSNPCHGKILKNGDYLNRSTGKKVGNLFDYVY